MEDTQKKQVGVNVSSWKIFIGFIVGAIIGLVFNKLKHIPAFEPTITTLTDKLFFPLGDAFLQSLFMIVVPIIFSSLIVGVSKLGTGKNLGQLSARLFLFYAFSTILAISIGQALVNSVQPGKAVGQEEVQEAVNKWQDKLQSIQMKSSMVGSSLWPGIVRTIIPRNIIDQFGATNILAVIFVSLLFGVALRSLPDGSA